MKRRTALPLGIVMLGLGSAYLAAFGPQVLTGPFTGALLAGFVLSAVLMIVGGLVGSVPVGDRTVPWNAFVGVGDVLLAVVVTLSAIRSALAVGDTVSWAFAAAMLAGGTSIAWFGVQTARDSRHVDLEATPSSRRVVAIAALVAVSVAVGALVATGP